MNLHISLIWTFWNFYIVQNCRSVVIFTTKSHHISLNLTKSYWISPNLPNLTKSHHGSPNVTKSYEISKSRHILPNLIESHQISPFLPKLNVRVGLHVGQYYRGTCDFFLTCFIYMFIWKWTKTFSWEWVGPAVGCIRGKIQYKHKGIIFMTNAMHQNTILSTNGNSELIHHFLCARLMRMVSCWCCYWSATCL